MLFIPDQVQKTLKARVKSVDEEAQALSLPTLTSEVKEDRFVNGPLPTRVESPANTTILHTRPRKSPFQGKPSVMAGKRKHEPKPPSIRHSEDTSSDPDDAGDLSGDGSSSGESIDSDVQTPAKRPRISTITTRSSARTTYNAAEARIAVEHEGTPPASTTPSESANLQPPGTTVDLMGVDDATSDPPPIDTHAGSILSTGTDSTRATIPPATAENIIATESADDGSEHNLDMLPIADVCPIATVAVPPTSLSVTDPDKVPPFLRRHGTGNRRVDIFEYLNRVKDPHFQKVLFHYINFEINDKSNSPGSLPTAKRPPEIAQWTARARPEGLPDYTKGKRTFSVFVDSILAWWSSLQPSWRSFEWGSVSRQVGGSWGALYAPRINGMLNVVILAYWWIRVLEEHKPKDGNRTDYEFFADDISWVLSQLGT